MGEKKRKLKTHTKPQVLPKSLSVGNSMIIYNYFIERNID